MGREHWKSPSSAHNLQWMSGSTKGLVLGLVMKSSVFGNALAQQKTAVGDIIHLRFTLFCYSVPFSST